jgi:DNA gyrase/topoisomerase IV subunit B
MFHIFILENEFLIFLLFLDVKVKAHMIKNHLWIFVNALLNNPEFDSQTKETLKSKVSSWGTKCEFSEDFLKKGSCIIERRKRR